MGRYFRLGFVPFVFLCGVVSWLPTWGSADPVRRAMKNGFFGWVSADMEDYWQRLFAVLALPLRGRAIYSEHGQSYVVLYIGVLDWLHQIYEALKNIGTERTRNSAMRSYKAGSFHMTLAILATFLATRFL